MSNLFDILNFDSNEAKEDGKDEEQAGNGAQFDRQEDGSCQEEANMADKNICRGEVDDEMQSPPSYELTVEGSDSQFESSVDKISMPVQLMKSFIIPRKKRKCKELLQNVSLTSREYLRDISPIITKGYRDHTSRGRFLYEEVHLVNNEELTKEFKEKRKEMKCEGRTEKELTESHAFLSVENLEQVRILSLPPCSLFNC
ncbi:protein TASOR-like [Ptychodera flava]|uniref:protein TASOR-like n=1 Tax=Ptychodera flava TaxID=63121 RepID=UPI00396A3101